MKTATIQVLQSEKKALQSENKFVVTEFDEECIGNPAAANSMITYTDYSERKKNRVRYHVEKLGERSEPKQNCRFLCANF